MSRPETQQDAEVAGDMSIAQIAEWYIRRWEQREGRPWPQSERRRVLLPSEAEIGG